MTVGDTDGPATLFGVEVSGAVISECERYRYRLWRVWDDTKPRLAWIMNNPSKVDAEKNDPTITRLFGFTRSWGYGGFTVVNARAFRSTDPDALPADEVERCGPDNDAHLRDVILSSAEVVCAWGAHKGAAADFGRFMVRNPVVEPGTLSCLGTTAAGHPKHPLYLASTTPLQPFSLSAVSRG